jgi:hypothetical protein
VVDYCHISQRTSHLPGLLIDALSLLKIGDRDGDGDGNEERRWTLRWSLETFLITLNPPSYTRSPEDFSLDNKHVKTPIRVLPFVFDSLKHIEQ